MPSAVMTATRTIRVPDFIDGAAPMEIRRMEKKDGGMLRQYIPARLADNPTLLEADPDYIDRLDGLGNPVTSMTFGERKQYRFFPYFVSIRAEDLIKWQINPDDHQFDFVVFRSAGTAFEGGPFSKEIDITTVTLWTRDTWQTFTSRDGSAFTETGSGVAGVDESALEGITIKYNETFDPEAQKEQLTARYVELRKDGDISRETVWERLGMTAEQIEEEKARMAAEQEEDARGMVGAEGATGSLVSSILGRGMKNPSEEGQV